MGDSIYSTDSSFDFNTLNLAKPQQIPGGNYFMRMTVSNKPVYIQPPKCIMKQGFLKSGKRYYSDLMFSNENTDFIEWMENIENRCQKIIYDKGAEWFEEKIEIHDIEEYFTSPLKIFKSGKYYNLRVNVALNLGKPLLKVYNENEELVSIDEIKEKTNVMTILELKGIKCSATCFQIEIEVKQMMIVQPNNIFEQCLFKPKTPAYPLPEVPPTPISTPVSAPAPEFESPIMENMQSMDLVEETKNIETEEVTIEDVDEQNEESIIIENEENDMSNSNETEIKLIENNENNLEEKEEITQPLENNSDDGETSTENLEHIETEKPELEEVNFTLDKINENDCFTIKSKNNVYYEMYKEAKRKAKVARDLALSSYLEAKRIKNVYMLEDTTDSDEDSDYENIVE